MTFSTMLRDLRFEVGDTKEHLINTLRRSGLSEEQFDQLKDLVHGVRVVDPGKESGGRRH